jgi:hypothetical protein
MYSSLLKLILLTTLAAFGMSYAGFFSCHSRECLRQVDRRTRDILKIDWKPISVFPEEAKRFLPKQPKRR